MATDSNSTTYRSPSPMRSFTSSHRCLYWRASQTQLSSESVQEQLHNYPRDSDTLLFRLLGKEKFLLYAPRFLRWFSAFTLFITIFFSIFPLLVHVGIIPLQYLWICFVLLFHCIFTMFIINSRLAKSILLSFDTMYIFIQLIGYFISGSLSKPSLPTLLFIDVYVVLVVIFMDATPFSAKLKSISIVLICITIIVKVLLLVYQKTILFEDLNNYNINNNLLSINSLSNITQSLYYSNPYYFEYSPLHLNVDLRDFFINRTIQCIIFLANAAITSIIIPDSYIGIKLRAKTSTITDEIIPRTDETSHNSRIATTNDDNNANQTSCIISIPIIYHSSDPSNTSINHIVTLPSSTSRPSVVTVNNFLRTTILFPSPHPSSYVFWKPIPLEIHPKSIDCLLNDYPRDSDTLAYKLVGEEQFYRYYGQLFYRLSTVAISIIAPVVPLFIVLSWTNLISVHDSKVFSSVCSIIFIQLLLIIPLINWRLFRRILFTFEAVFSLVNILGFIVSMAIVFPNDIRLIPLAVTGYMLIMIIFHDAMPVSNFRRLTFLVLVLVYFVIWLFVIVMGWSIIDNNQIGYQQYILYYGPMNIRIDIRDFAVNRAFTMTFFLVKLLVARISHPRTFIHLRPRILTSVKNDTNE